ncbi:MAG: TetR/AcrR family transcriptional regulator [Bacteroidaceae bacterium]|nr:TetR/AcrR family transcriptional regulator [Bacteroidaceae bacterium]MBQ2460462.1 TetR/AcrR family transcriptional regulator [Bacteroidaceae bacterium]MBQ2519109.1 TetR/AcrR family transcriptional regulator [Bacteroidaceae bacterium]MBQ2595890.1 TetR/AcrR family transcriptional regulator [Bacteroidaceae bacterium]MBQ3958475.1 TetR/AcrR family transcriptional regulator [Bacteroidaceae bacterium]
MAVTKTRNRLVDVARQIFAKRGLENTTMNDIAVASGKGRRTLYTYFKSKEDLYLAVIEGELVRLLQYMNEMASTSEMSAEEKLVSLIYTHLNLVKEAVQRNGNLRAEFFRDIITVERVRKRFDENERNLFAGVVAEGVRTGEFEIDSIPLFVDILHFSLKGLEIPYIYGRLGRGLAQGVSHAIVQKMLHKMLTKNEKPNITF